MSSIDERVVAMRFQDSGFAQGIKRTLDGLSALRAGLNLDGATKSISDLDAAGKKLDLSQIGASTDGISAKFVAMATVAITALAGIAAKAIQVGGQLVSSLTVDPIKSGLEEYETNLNAIQTILANTQSKGTVLTDVNDALQELNEYSDKTIYNFSEMARNIGTFTAAGVNLDTSVNAIKGIANLAAVSGSNSQQASTAMYQLSQALATGTVKLMDWNSVVNAGMGGEVFQTAIKETARVHGVAVDDLIEKNGSFRDSLQEGWLTSEILTETLSKFTGDLTAAQLETMGYNQEQIQGILTMGQTAQDAATKVKTMSQLIGTLKESAQSGWSQTWQIVAGDFEEAKEMWTGVNNVLGGMIGASADARNTLLQGWKDLGGRDLLLQGLQDGFQALMRLIGPVKRAFEEIFPPQTAFQLYMLTQRFAEFMQSLKIGGETSANLTRIFKGVFAAFDIGIEVVKAVIGIFGELFSGAGEGASNFLDFSAGIGDWIVNLRDAIKHGDGFKEFIADVTRYVRDGVRFVKDFAEAISNLFSAGAENSAEGMSGALERIQTRLEPLGAVGDAIVAVWSRMGGVFQQVWDFFTPLASAMSEFFGNIGDQISNATQDMDFSQVLDTVNTGLFAGLVVIMRRFLSNGINLDIGGGFLDSAKSALDGVSGTLQAMQTNLKADTLMKIASALGILVLAVIGLTLIDSDKLTTALLALTVMFTQLAAAMAVFEKIGTTGSAIKMTILGAAMIVLATAILILTAAVKALSTMEWEELAKGLTGVIVLLGALAGAAKLLTMNSGGLISAGLGMIAVAVAIKILASAVEDFAAMSWEDMARGLAGVGATLLALGLFTRLLEAGKMGISQGVGLVLLAAALKVLASAVGDFADMDYESLARGIGSVAVVLGVIAGAMKLMQGALPGAAALLIVSGSLVVLAQVLQQMAGMTWDEIAHGLAVLAGSLVLIAFAMQQMTTALPGAAALLIVVGALTLLAPILAAFSVMSWEEIGKGLAMLAGVFLVFGLAGLALTPVIPTLLGLGIAIGLIGAGVLMAGAGILAFSIALTALSAASAVGTVALVAMVSAMIGLIPTVIEALGQGLVLLIGVLAAAGPQFLDMAVMLITTLVTAIATVAPLIISTLVSLILQLVDAVVRLVPQLAAAGLALLTGLLNAIAAGLPSVISAGTDVIIALIEGIGESAARIAEAGADTIIEFVNSLANTIETKSAEMNAAGSRLASAIISGMTSGLTNGISTVVNKAKEVAQSALNAAKNLLGIKSPSREFYKIGDYSTQGMAKGLHETSGVVEHAAEGVGESALDGLRNSMSKMQDVSIGVETAPVIRPVVDLTDVRKGAREMDGMFASSSTVAPVASYDKATVIAQNDARTQAAIAEEREMRIRNQREDQRKIVFNQYNNSPKALSSAEIYRQTKNQISVVKGGLPK